MLKSKAKAEVKSWLKSMIIAGTVVVVMRTFLFSPYIVEGSSMEPTLHNNERIFVNKLQSSFPFSRGDIIIIKGAEENYVKRVMGFPGDKIEIKNDKLFINGKQIKENYLSENQEEADRLGSKLMGDFGPITVPKTKYFVLGDNRMYSMDSRNGLGLIEEEAIVGKSEFVFYPLSNFRDVE